VLDVYPTTYIGRFHRATSHLRHHHVGMCPVISHRMCPEPSLEKVQIRMSLKRGLIFRSGLYMKISQSFGSEFLEVMQRQHPILRQIIPVLPRLHRYVSQLQRAEEEPRMHLSRGTIEHQRQSLRRSWII
jgi:hypothetical protein